MKTVNKNILLLTTLLLTIVVFTGCSKMPDGFENKKFLKDMDKVRDLTLRSCSAEEYNTEIDDILSKMNDEKYKSKLNEYELLILEATNEVMPKVKLDLTTGDHVITSDVFDEFLLIREAIISE